MSRPYQVPTRRLEAHRGGWRLLLTIGLVILLPACAVNLFERHAVKTDDPGAKACQERCDLGKTQCEQRQQTREAACTADFNSDSEAYRLCKSKGGARRCRGPVSCLGADLSICQRELLDCVVDCGGRVERQWHPSVTPMLDRGPRAAPAPGPQTNGAPPASGSDRTGPGAK